MSRLYEALKRADLERKTAPMAQESPFAGSVVKSGAEQPPSAKGSISIEEIARQPWNLSVASFPTLADHGQGVEQFRSLRSRIYQARYESPLKTILVSSGIPSEGKTFIAANLSMTLARNTANQILLIDADLRRPALHSVLGAPKTPGLTEYLAGTAELKDVLQHGSFTYGEPSGADGIPNLAFIPSGNCGDNSAELLANHRIEEMVEILSSRFDWIIIDSPPVLAVTDAVELSHAADAVLLVARGENTTYEVAQRVTAAFSNARILGFVLNDTKEMPHKQYGYYNYHHGSGTTNRE